MPEISKAQLIASLTETERLTLLSELSEETKANLKYDWSFWSRPSQQEPPGIWTTWLILSGRGFGKSRTGAETIRKWVCGSTPLSKGIAKNIALVAETSSDARDVMVEGPAGLLTCHPKDFRPLYEPSKRRVTWPNGASATLFNAVEPDQLRGPQFDCFVAGTKISTPSGEINIENLNIGDFVLTRDGPQQIYDARTSEKETITVRFNNGRSLTGTPEHPILTKDGWKSLITLTTEDQICAMTVLNTVVNGGITTDTITNTVEPEVSTGLIETISTEPYIKTILEKFPKVLMSTTKTGINETIPPRISNCSPEATTENIMFLKNQYRNVTGVEKNTTSVSVRTVGSNKNEDNITLEECFVQVVKDVGQNKSVIKNTVWNISVRGMPEYIANGILVHNCAWCDELAKWRYINETWDQLQFGLRLGERPRQIITTTPRPLPLIRRLLVDPDTVVTRGRTFDNETNLAAPFLRQIQERYGGTRLGRQELEGEVLDDIPGAMFQRADIDLCRVSPEELPELERIIVAVDPAASSNEDSDETGIVVVGTAKDKDGYSHGYVLEDASLRGTPDEWATRAVSLYRKYSADRIVAENNNGGEMVESVLRSVDRSIPFKPVFATRGKHIRAEPISALYEQHRIHHAGSFDKLEDQMVTFSVDNIRSNGFGSPDRVDALVWGLTELFGKITGRRKIDETKKVPAKPVLTGNASWLAR